MRLQGIVSETYRVEYSTNLVTWLPLATNTLVKDGLLNFTDTTAPVPATRFYRAVKLP
jgi:hypothetical protein